MPSASAMLTGFGVNLLVTLLIARFIYYPTRRSHTYVFTFITFSTIVYFVMMLLGSTDLSVGVGFGLFALFSVLRYRTDTLPTREMTYVFVFMAVPIINALLLPGGYYAQAATANLAIVLVLFVLERGWGFRFEGSQRLRYDRVELVKPERYGELLEDLRARTGLPLTRVEVVSLDLLRDSAELKLYYPAQTRTRALDNETPYKAHAPAVPEGGGKIPNV